MRLPTTVRLKAGNAAQLTINSMTEDNARKYEKLAEEGDEEMGLIPKHTTRFEEPWSDAQEALLAKWRKAAFDASVAHENAGQAAKKKNVVFGLPALLIPLCMTPASAVLKGVPWFNYVEMVGFMASGCASALVTFFDLSAKKEKHFQYSARYGDLVTDIDAELARPREFRQHCDTFQLKVKMWMDGLNRAAPAL